MKQIKMIIAECATDAEVIVCLLGLILGYTLVAITFWQFHWLCGVLSVYFTTTMLSISVKVWKVIEKKSDNE